MKAHRLTLLWLVLLTLMAFCGCASAPMATKTEDATAKSLSAPADKSNIYLMRRAGIFGAAIAFQVQVDGKLLGPIPPDTFHLVTVQPGDHAVSVMSGENADKLKVSTEAGKNYFFQVQPHWGVGSPRASIKQLPDEEGRIRVQNSKLAQRLD